MENEPSLTARGRERTSKFIARASDEWRGRSPAMRELLSPGEPADDVTPVVLNSLVQKS